MGSIALLHWCRFTLDIEGVEAPVLGEILQTEGGGEGGRRDVGDMQKLFGEKIYDWLYAFIVAL